MANPQLEDGHTRIVNSILEEVLKVDIPIGALKIFLAIIRKTWGWDKTIDWVSITQFQNMTGYSRMTVCRSLKWLVDNNMVKKTGKPHKPKYGIQKDYTKWPNSNRKVTSNKDGIVTILNTNSNNPVTQVVTNLLPTKETITKEKDKKEFLPVFWELRKKKRNG